MQQEQKTVTSKVRTILVRLERLVKEYAEASKTRLPTAKKIAAEIGVSPVTLFKALDILRQRGVISLSPKRGILIVPKTVNSAFDLAAGADAEHVRSGQDRTALEQLILHDIFVGAFSRADALPQIKELMGRYGVRFETLKAALNALTEEKVLTIHKRRFAITARTTFRGRSRLVVFTKDTSRAIAEYTPRSAQFWRLLESECVGRGIELDLRSFDEVSRESPAASAGVEGRSRRQSDVLGYILLTVNTAFSELHNLLARLKSFYRPVAILDEVGDIPIPSVASDSLLMRLFVMSTTMSAGKAAGYYLLNHGHRRAAYFTVFSSAAWSLNRFRGIEDAFAGAGMREGVTRFGCALTDEWTALLDPRPESEPYARLAPLLARIQRIMNPAGTVDERALYREWFSSLWQLRIEAVLTPLFERALADRSITAWIAENDDTGFAALKFLNERRVRMPEDLSVIAFDDTTGALTAGLTSFDFNVPALVYAVMNHILFSASARRLVKRGPIEIPGMIMERKTSGPARRMIA